MCFSPGFGFHSLPLINRGEKCSVQCPDLWYCFLTRDNATDVNISGGVGMNKNPAVLFLPYSHSSTAINRLTHTQLWFEATAEQLLVSPCATTLCRYPNLSDFFPISSADIRSHIMVCYCPLNLVMQPTLLLHICKQSS